VSSLASLEPVAQIGRYDVIGRLASGGMAEIFLARERGPHTVGRHLVLKRILPHVATDERMVEMFVHEAKLCMHLRHPNICPIYEFGEEGGSFYLAMEWVRGISLRDLIDRVGGALPVPMVTKIFADIAGAGQFASPEDVPFSILLPAFVTSELKTAFQIGFMLFLPFLVIDLVVSSVLMSLGMMMMSPMIVSLPFKLLLFVLVDGWALLMGSLASSFG